MTAASHRRTLLASGLAAGLSALALPRSAAAFPLNLPFGGKKAKAPKPVATKAVDLAGIVRETGAPAVACAVVGAQGLIYLDAAGRRRIDGEALVNRDDPWALAANTQGLTCALFARYVQAGKTGWGATLGKLFPDLTLDPAWTDTRLVDVLSHRAGVTDVGVIDSDWIVRFDADKAPVQDQRTAVVKALFAKPPARPPGGFEYAGLNYVVAGAALERLAKRPFEAAMRTDLMGVLGMSAQAGFGAPTGPSAPWGHHVAHDNRLVGLDPEGGGFTPAVLNAAGGVALPMADYARFLRVFLTNGGDLFTPDTLNRLGRPWGGADGEFGLGWQAVREEGWAQGPVLQHEGSDGDWHVLAKIGPARGLAIVAASNADAGGGAEAVRRTTQALIKAYAV